MFRFSDPFEEMDRVMNQVGGRWRGGLMPMDAFEKEGVYTLKFDLPGVEPDHVDLTVDSGVLRVTVDRKMEDTEGANWLLRERATGTTSREIRLGNRLDSTAVEASYDQGVLTVTLPIKEEAKPRRVSIGGGDQKAIDVEASS
ncbi:MAG: Hsp20/alpha crystallin family protein [Acidimicrobiia bacterium]|nr:Hsp20/alpha crystallin family protein [Acidimicrobiia bacterium]NNL71364.1 Hsp20/alpha crystallin family protein [Acidimicrobiia bacterium]